MTIVRRITIVISVMLVLMLVVAGVGVGAMAWLQSWHGDYTKAIEGTAVADDPALQDMLGTLDSRSSLLLIVIAVVVAIAVAAGIAGAVLLARKIGRQLRGAVSSLGSSSAELLAIASQVAAATAQTAAATNETTATVEEVRQTAMMAQEKAVEASEKAGHVAEMCGYGAKSSQQNYGMFERIKADMDVVVEAIDRLNEQAQSVGDIISTVNDIAEQSNLLSVNASIEAAKAGEQGKGFIVVAQEVKSLAEQSKQAVAQVRGVLSEIQHASDVAVRAAEQSREAVDAGRSEAGRGIENTKDEVDWANKAAEATTQISMTTQQQLAGMEQIGQAIASINEAGNQSAVGTRQVEKEARQLQELALSLQSLVELAPSKRT